MTLTLTAIEKAIIEVLNETTEDGNPRFYTAFNKNNLIYSAAKLVNLHDTVDSSNIVLVVFEKMLAEKTIVCTPIKFTNLYNSYILHCYRPAPKLVPKHVVRYSRIG